jgi:hypothetical protein
VLCPDEVVPQFPSLLLGKDKDTAGTVGETLEDGNRLSPWGSLRTTSGHMGG